MIEWSRMIGRMHRIYLTNKVRFSLSLSLTLQMFDTSHCQFNLKLQSHHLKNRLKLNLQPLLMIWYRSESLNLLILRSIVTKRLFTMEVQITFLLKNINQWDQVRNMSQSLGELLEAIQTRLKKEVNWESLICLNL